MIRGQLDSAVRTIAHLSALVGERMCDVGHIPVFLGSMSVANCQKVFSDILTICLILPTMYRIADNGPIVAGAEVLGPRQL